MILAKTTGAMPPNAQMSCLLDISQTKAGDRFFIGRFPPIRDLAEVRFQDAKSAAESRPMSSASINVSARLPS